MTPDTALASTLALIGRIETLSAPAVEPVRSVIRSGDQFLIGGQTEMLPHRDAKKGAQPTAGPYLGGVVVEWGYDVEHACAAQFHRWLEDNEADLRKFAPRGCHYWGTYAIFAQSDLSLGSYRTVWAYENLAAMSLLDEALADKGSRFAVLINELSSFRDKRIGAGRSQQIFHPAAGARRI